MVMVTPPLREKRDSLHLRLAFPVLLGWVLLLLALPGAAGAARPLYTGLSGVFDYNDLAYQRVAATGASFVRIGVPWGAIAPDHQPQQWDPESPGDPNYNWGHVDGAVRNAVAAGLTPVLIVTSAPAWAQGCALPSGYPEAVCDPDPGQLGKFATAAARRFSGSFAGLPRVTYWQGMNEPNLSLYFLPQFEGGKPVSAYLYRRIANSFYAAIKSVNPSNLVLAAGLGPIAVPRYTIGPLKFARELFCLKSNLKPLPGDCEGGVNFDIFDVHPYTTGGPTHEGGPNDVELGDIPELVEVLRAADRAKRIHGAYKRTPLWITEFSWDSKPPDPHGLPIKIESRWIDEALYLTWRAGVDHFFWFGLRDEPLLPDLPSSASAQSGMYFTGPTLADDKPKPYMYAFRFPFVAYPGGGKLGIWGRTPTSHGGKVTIELRRGSGWRPFGTLKAGANGIFQGSFRTSYGADQRGAARARFEGTDSVPFSMRPVPDFFQRPFG